MNKLILTYVMICIWFCPSIRVWREGRWTCHFGVVLSFSDRGRVKGTRGHVPPGAHMEGKDPSAFSRQAPALHARRKWPMRVRTVQARRGTLPQPHAHFTDQMHAWDTLGHVGVRSRRTCTVYRTPRLQRRTYVYHSRGEREERAVLSHCVRVAWYFNLVGSVYIAHAAGGGTEDGWRDVSNTSYKRDIYTRAR